MLSAVSPPAATHQKQSAIVVENGVPVELREVLKRCYDVEEDAELFLLPNTPNKIFVVHQGQLRTIDLSACEAIRQGNIMPDNDDRGTSPDIPVEDTETDGQVAPPATPVTPLRITSVTERCLHGTEWQKAISDKERELLQKERRRTSAYKTSLCNAFRDTGQCSYGLQCRFAHGINELRPAPGPHPKYKTQLCNKFALYGSCPYGARCQFIHMRPCETPNDYSPPVNFSSSLDGRGSHAFRYQYYSRSGRARFYGKNTYVFEPPGPGRDTAIAQQYGVASSLQEGAAIGMQYSHYASEAIWFQRPPNQGPTGYMEGPVDVMPMAGASGLSSEFSAMDDLFGTLNIGESSNPFTQSCFPRINMESCGGTAAPTDISYMNNTTGIQYCNPEN